MSTDTLTELHITELHIASFVAHVRPESLKDFLSWTHAQPELEVPAQNEQGKVILVTECTSQQTVLATIDNIEQRPGVLGCTLVYHEVMDQQDADKMETSL
ncbi:chaperone NapD [Nitrincola sp. MINF-07-Sa-05]|uniref:chaperone NapD n=1 Tax=Nitrincola salilacus TaxID=3400273 RepID=UPI0039184EAB